MRIERLVLTAYGRARDVGVDIGDGVTVVLGVNEAGKSTSLDALSDFLWGISRGSAGASELAPNQLRIDAVVNVAGDSCAVVRKSTGLFAEDLATEFPAQWNPTNQLTAQWWRTRLGINHADLRRGGSEVFAGSGDIADIIFAAREGRSAREVLKEITDQADKLFKPDGRSKRVQVRLAVEEYKRAVADRDGRLTRASAVVAQREAVQELEGRRSQLRRDAAVTSQKLKREDENGRVVGHVLRLHRATGELDAIDQQGDRLSPAELADYQKALTAFRSAEERISKLDSGIATKTGVIDGLSIDDRLLDDRETFSRLQPDANARIDDLRRAGEEFGAAVEEATTGLWQLLGSIGVERTDDLDDALAGARIRDDHAATLNELADQIETLEGHRQDARQKRDDALGELLGKGVTVEIATAAAPDGEAIDRIRKALIQARNDEGKATALLAEAAAAVQVLQASDSDPYAPAALTPADVTDARGARDAQWGAIRRSWVTGELPVPAERVDIAAEFDAAVAAADRVADDEAGERSRVAALDARAELHVEGLDAARRKQQDATTHLETEAEDCRRAAEGWAAVWADLGIANPPDVDSSSVVVGLLSTAHVAQARERSATEQLAGFCERWDTAAELVGLPPTTTAAAWHKRSDVLAEIATVDAQRIKDRKREAQARGRWGDFATEATALLLRHALIEEDRAVTPAVIEQGFANLGRQLEAAAEAAARRTTHLEQIEEMHTERDEVRQVQQQAADSLQRLVESHRVDGEQDLVVLADRAVRAADPLHDQEEAVKAIRNGLDPASDLQDVIDRLAGHDEVTVGEAVEDAQVSDREARQAAELISTEYGLARERLTELERAAGAADAEAAVAARQAEVARLVEAWMVAALQRKLLEDVLDGLGSGDARPLLDHAGRLLEQLTGGRWVALRADEDGATRTLRVIRADNVPFEPKQLSEGTADQVFFALRLAAVAELHRERVQAGEAALPLVLDDVLMAFDEARVRSALQILVTLAPGLQVIVFTHHQHVADAAEGFDSITVSRLPEAAMIADPLDGELIRAQAST
ncbi:AAA family ATPase [Mycobacterium sp. M1]|uniref:AAA family ATPase n=1 Tax=Mycolicibacter acidiphilus TaxID=2835306 RepID=A0ABS5RPB7_9MYCO|nr:AAA family ATPase [Mycolicibacter acidiphilus]MBS9535356.1 AAA family ATPase [Mycolicibacter acidiphilus]